MLMPEIVELVRNATTDVVQELSLERVVAEGGCEFCWQSLVCVAISDRSPVGRMLCANLLANQDEAKRIIAACLGMM